MIQKEDGVEKDVPGDASKKTNIQANLSMNKATQLTSPSSPLQEMAQRPMLFVL